MNKYVRCKISPKSKNIDVLYVILSGKASDCRPLAGALQRRRPLCRPLADAGLWI